MECIRCGEALRTSPNEDGVCKSCVINELGE